ncbi:MAG: ferrous iron transport protein A [Calditrichaeota bacterium]|nr:ferrous iron transport protein A [Calditrichota bacterium]
MRLGDVPSGSEVRVCCLDGAGPIARRLAEMGFVPGTLIEVVRRAPLSDPIEFRLRGYLVSLRREEALLIRVHSTLSDPSAIGQAPAGDASDR